MAAAQSAVTGVQQQHQPQMLDVQSGPAMLQDVDTLLFDCDGVLWRGNTLVNNAAEASTCPRDADRL